ncbi:MAG: hypothetical protein MMC23_006785 [Stictis urceolatum]|nr:hypothetical protein [Stictis urceolata]
MEPLGRFVFDPAFVFGGRDEPEEEPLLTESELVEDGVCLLETTDANGHITKSHEHLPVFDNIHAIRRDILENIVYCFLVNRIQFLREQAGQAHHQTVATTRALLCEIIAARILRRFEDAHPGPAGLLLLANILVAGFTPFQNAPPDVREAHSMIASLTDAQQHQRKTTALEIAIISDSKTFLSSSPCQKVVEAIYQGRVIYTPTSYMDLLPDHYKRRPITLYDPRTRPLLNQYRLIVPRTRNIMELASFIILLALYVAVMDERDPTHISGLETVFCVFAWGWVLEQFASMIEHGWKVYTQNLWAFLDVTFVVVYVVYFGMRMHAHQQGNEHQARLAFHVLAAGAPVLIPRLAFNLLSENMLFVSLRAMMSNFFVLTLLAVWCFGGFLLAMNWMGNEEHGPLKISKWMLYVWFGLDGTGIQKSVEFHWLLGPVLMVTFAFLGNTLFLTILVSMLSHTFSQIVSNSTAEIQFRRAVLTFECVKADAIFAFFPPFNILALVFFLPLKLFLSPRWFHKAIITAVRILNMPLLLAIGLYERRALWSEERRRRAALAGHPPRKSAWWVGRKWDQAWGSFNMHADIQSVFDAEPPPDPSEDCDQGIDEREDDPGTAIASPVLERGDPFSSMGAAFDGAKSENPTSGNPFSSNPAAVPNSRTVSVKGLQRAHTERSMPALSRAQTSQSGFTLRPRRRKDSFPMGEAFGDVAEHLQGLLSEYDGEGARERIEGLEEGLRRIEGKLDRLVMALAGAGSSGRNTPTPGGRERGVGGGSVGEGSMSEVDGSSRRGSWTPSQRGREG